MRDINPKVTADGQGALCYKCPFSHLLALSVVFQAFLKLGTSNKKYKHKNVSVYPVCKFEDNCEAELVIFYLVYF